MAFFRCKMTFARLKEIAANIAAHAVREDVLQGELLDRLELIAIDAPLGSCLGLRRFVRHVDFFLQLVGLE